MYLTNSSINVIYAYDYALETGEATNRHVFTNGKAMGLTKDVYGNPDGICIDKEGSLWSARCVPATSLRCRKLIPTYRWEGSRVVRFTPDGKGIDLEIHIPKAYNVTACCFGGKCYSSYRPDHRMNLP